MTHHVRAIFERELSQMNWKNGMSRADIIQHFHMAPTIREMLEDKLPNKSFKSAQDVMKAIPDQQWNQVEQQIEQGSPESHYLEGRVAHFDIRGQTPGFGHISEQEQHRS